GFETALTGAATLSQAHLIQPGRALGGRTPGKSLHTSSPYGYIYDFVSHPTHPLPRLGPELIKAVGCGEPGATAWQDCISSPASGSAWHRLAHPWLPRSRARGLSPNTFVEREGRPGVETVLQRFYADISGLNSGTFALARAAEPVVRSKAGPLVN